MSLRDRIIDYCCTVITIVAPSPLAPARYVSSCDTGNSYELASSVTVYITFGDCTATFSSISGGLDVSSHL